TSNLISVPQCWFLQHFEVLDQENPTVFTPSLPWIESFVISRPAAIFERPFGTQQQPIEKERNTMKKIKLVSFLVDDYDPAIEFYTQKLCFEVVEDAAFSDLRWITLSLPGNRCAIALELAKTPDDLAVVVGRQG